MIGLLKLLGFSSGKKFSQPPRVVNPSPVVKGSYDAARNSSRLDDIFAQATSQSANAEGNATARAIIRNRARHEYRNNGYCCGMVDTKANDIVGRSPILEMQTDNADFNSEIEEEFLVWANEINLGSKIRLAATDKEVSGESFITFINNLKLENLVKLDLLIVEADRVTSTIFNSLLTSKNFEDGIHYDDNGRPVSYDILRVHPGDTNNSFGNFREFDPIPAERVLHWYKKSRPGQRRGVSEIASAIPIFAQLRRYTIAVLTSSETAANASWVLASQDKDADPVQIDPMDEIELNIGSGLTLPRGWGMQQMRAEQPSTTYPDFKRELLSEAARCLNMPLNVAIMNSRGFNFASGRLDHLNYNRDNQVKRSDLSRDILSRIFAKWFQERRLVKPGRPNIISISAGVPQHDWHYDGTEHQDPAKEASAQERRLKNLTSNLAIEYSRIGLDWRKALEQIAAEKELKEKLGLTTEETVPMTPEELEEEQDDQSKENAA